MPEVKMTDQRPPQELLEELRVLYGKRGKGTDFSAEKSVYQDLIPKLIEDLGSDYVLDKLLGLGSTATVWIVFDRKLQQKRALKLPRPRLGKLKDIIQVLRAERIRLAALNHQNVIKIYTSGEVALKIEDDDYSFPYFVMEYLEDVKDIDAYIVERHLDLKAGDVIAYFRDILNGLSFLHSQSIVHCDIKPGNLLIAPGRPALVADMGYAKHLYKVRPGEEQETAVIHTPIYAHPELKDRMVESADSAASVSKIPRENLRAAFDLFALGRTMQEVLSKLRDAERNEPAKHFGARSIFSPYQWLYLGYISKRLLDGRVVTNDPDDLKADVIPGLTERIMGEIRYRSADEALEDFEKLLHLYDLEGEIPELNPNLSSFIQIPHCRVPLTIRVREVINHPTFARLARVTQLGFVSLLYPGATHTRYEHVLGTFTHYCAYVRSLWYDQSNPLFQSVMSKEDIELGLISSLLHDIAQYPMAHDLTEVSSEFAHERFTQQVLERTYRNCEESLAHVLKAEWGIDVEDVMKVIDADGTSAFRHRLLNSLMDGPLDCDKLDYLKRDSTHLGITFGQVIDDERLLRHLTIVYESTHEPMNSEVDSRHQSKLRVAEIGVTEKGLTVAQSVWRVRKDMFTQAYWHHPRWPPQTPPPVAGSNSSTPVGGTRGTLVGYEALGKHG